jgi:ubiquinone/menaquinone biosynthesis C-methylase UbiE
MAESTVATVPTGNSYNKYSTRNPIERWLMNGFLRSLDKSLPAAAPELVLEVGMGEGEIAARVRERYFDASIVGIDLPDQDLAATWADKKLHGAFADITHLPFPSRCFDLVLAIEVLEHVPDPDAALRELAPGSIERINMLPAEEATERFGPDGRRGAFLVRTRKG